MTSVLFEHLGKLQESYLLVSSVLDINIYGQSFILDNMQDSGRSSMIESPEGTLKTLLKEVSSSLATPKLLPVCTTSYLISLDGSSGLVWDELSKEQACLHSTLSTLEIDGLVTNPFVEVRHTITSHTDTVGMMVSYILPVAFNGSL